jgi:uracil-DNA glycosylase
MLSVLSDLDSYSASKPMSSDEVDSATSSEKVFDTTDTASDSESGSDIAVVYPTGWEEVIISFENELNEIYYILKKEMQKGKQIHPKLRYIFRFFYETPLKDVRVVIMGREPYHNPGQANGLAFSVDRGVDIPPTLMNIYCELKSEIDNFNIPNHGDLTKWARQGILLLNCSLTVEKERKITHEEVWRGIVKRTIKECSDKGGVIFVLWGKEASSFDQYIDTSVNKILKSSHPSPHSAGKGFFGCNHFKMINEILQPPIDWNL